MASKAVSSRDLLSWHEVGAAYREPFILTGYRRPGTSCYQCLQYAVVLHNEVGNFWTHFIPLLAWLVWLLWLAVTWEDFLQPYHYPMLCFWTGACSYALFSSIAHLFACTSAMVCKTCSVLDYVGIALYGLGLNMASLFYLSSTSSVLLSYPSVVIFIEAGLAISAALVAALTHFYWQDYLYLIRACSFLPTYLCSLLPYLHRVSVCRLYGSDCVPETDFWHALSILVTVVMISFYVSKIPERFMPGRFDIFFHSHQFFHLGSLSATSLQMYFMQIEIQSRKTVLSQVAGAVPIWVNTLLPFLAVCAFGALVGVCVYTGMRRAEESKKM